MIKVVGVRFRTESKIYYFDPRELEIKRDDSVIVEAAGGYEFGRAVSGIMELDETRVVQPLKPVLRIATKRDFEQEEENREKEKEAFRICQEKIKKHGLEMKLIDADYTFDNNKLLFHFTADGRVDFRELVKDLAAIFKTRIELRQIGVRDETRFLGGIGICGRPLCCCTYLTDLNKTVSIKMAKEQNLSLNPTKISGTCGRLMCCLRNEEETYEELNKRLPNVGDTVVTPDGQKGEVHSVNVLRQMVKVLVGSDEDKELKEFEVDRLKFRRHRGKKEQQGMSEEELKELERLEREEEEEMEAAIAAGQKAASEKAASGQSGFGRQDKLGQKPNQKRDRNFQNEKGERQKGEKDTEGRADQQSRGERQNRDKGERGDRKGQGERQNQERQGRGDRQNQERQGHGDRQNQERQGRGDRQNQDRQGRGDRQNQENGDRKNQRDRADRSGKDFDRHENKSGKKPFRDKNRSGDAENRQGNRDRQFGQGKQRDNQKKQPNGEE